MERQIANLPQVNHQPKSSGTHQPARPAVHPLLRLQQALGNQAAGRFIQAKLNISQPDDQYELEADRVAETVMRMQNPEIERLPPALSTSGIQRQVRDSEVEDELVQALEATGAIVQRQVNVGEQVDKEEEVTPLQAQPAGGSMSPTGTHPGHTINSLESGGQPLSPAVRNFMEPRFGQDFSHVRVHTGARANEAALAVNALAFTIGHNVTFAAGQYAPETSVGQRLLAHELSHVVQQNDQPSRVQRKIIVGGKPYKPTVKYYAYLDKNFGAHMKEFVKNMHNDGKPPDFTFASYEQMGTEVRVRHEATKGIDAAHGSCAYPDSANPDYLDSTYWDRIAPMYFKPKSPLPASKEASDAIEAIFAPGSGTRLECMAMTFAVEYYSLMKGLGKEKFNKLFPGGAGLEISNRNMASALVASKKYKVIAVSSKSEILPGDWVYFKNFKDYLVKHPGGYWRGENAIYMGGGLYRGFGVPSSSEEDMNKELIKAYTGKSTVDPKELAALLAEGGGLQLTPIARPDITKLAP